MWPSFKEFTECAAGFQGVMYSIDKLTRSKKNVVCYCVGDGHRPQMAAMISALTAWTRIYSIDPLLSVNKWQNSVSSKITMCKMTAEEFEDICDDAELSVVLAIH